jgi:hypothetical protein
MTSIPYTPTSPPRLLETMRLLTADESIVTWIGPDRSRHPISGGLAPHPGVDEGVIVRDVKGLMAPFKHLDQQSARQDGVDWKDTVWEPAEIDFTVTVFGQSPNGFRRAQKAWFDSWDPKLQGRMVWFSRLSGERWTDLRLLKEPSDQLKNTPAMIGSQDYTWSARADHPFWTGADSTSKLVASNSTTLGLVGGGANNFLPLWNRGDQDSWPRFLVVGPGTFTIGDGTTTAKVIFGPLTAGQQVLITTLPRIRSIIELTTSTNLFPLLHGRFGNPIPATVDSRIPVSQRTIHIPVTVTGATTGVTSITGSCTPYWKWPE